MGTQPIFGPVLGTTTTWPILPKRRLEPGWPRIRGCRPTRPGDTKQFTRVAATAWYVWHSRVNSGTYVQGSAYHPLLQDPLTLISIQY
jgi:hypothetical protein